MNRMIKVLAKIKAFKRREKILPGTYIVQCKANAAINVMITIFGIG